MRNPLTCHLDTAHLVDADGLVGCPRVGHDVRATACLSCAELILAVRDADARLTEIRCTPPPRQVRAPHDLLLRP